MTFNPAAPAGAVATKFSTDTVLNDVACPLATQCTAVDELGREVTFNPQAPTSTAPVKLDTEQENPLTSLTCPSATQCTALSQGGREVTFDPQTGLVDVAGDIDQGQGIQSIVCLSTASCDAVDSNGQVLTFNPVHPGTPEASTASTRARHCWRSPARPRTSAPPWIATRR